MDGGLEIVMAVREEKVSISNLRSLAHGTMFVCVDIRTTNTFNFLCFRYLFVHVTDITLLVDHFHPFLIHPLPFDLKKPLVRIVKNKIGLEVIKD